MIARAVPLLHRARPEFRPHIRRFRGALTSRRLVLRRSGALPPQSSKRVGVVLQGAVAQRPRVGPQSNLPEMVAELTETWGTAPDRLTLELAEGSLAETAAPEILSRLHAMGGTMSIDDFGTGYSSLAYLQRLPVHEIKIDRSFVTELVAASHDELIVGSTVDLAHNLGLTVVAEGVEDQGVLDLLVTYGCDSVQGYFFSHPCPAEELTKWLTESPYGVSARFSDPATR